MRNVLDGTRTSKLAPMTAEAASPLDSDERLRRYAELAVRVGANVQPGQEVASSARSSTRRPRARSCARPTEAGARRVVVRYADAHVRRARSSWARGHAGQSPSTSSPGASWREEACADPAHRRCRAGALRRSRSRARRQVRAARSERALSPLVAERLINWAIVASPNAGWATTVFGEPDLERLWEAVGSARGSTPPTPWPPGASTTPTSRRARRSSTSGVSTQFASAGREQSSSSA